MTGAMYAAIGGLKTHMSSLNVIGNNIANVNTAGYKAQRMTFQEAMYTTSRAGSNGTLVLGGNNPSQIGYGAQVGSIDLNMSPGTFNPTGLDLDCMIEGDGFFLVGDKTMTFNSGEDFTTPDLTRVGDFWQDANGYICNRDGKVVYGFKTIKNPFYVTNQTGDELTAMQEGAAKLGVSTEDEYIVSADLVPLRIPLAAAEPTRENGGLPVTGGTAADGYIYGEAKWKAGDPVYDLLGAVEPATTLGNGTARKNFSWVDEDGNVKTKGLTGTTPNGNLAYEASTGANTDSIAGLRITGGAGTVDGKGDAAGAGGTAGYLYSGPIPNDQGKCITIDGLKVTNTGAITGTCDNGQTVVVGYVAIAKVAAPDGVTHIGGPYYKCMEGAGDIKVGAVGGVMDGRYLNNQVTQVDQAGNSTAPNINDSLSPCSGTELRGGGLEASTADVATEFSNMILTQRGYQANTRIVTVTDSMLEELVNMKR